MHKPSFLYILGQRQSLRSEREQCSRDCKNLRITFPRFFFLMRKGLLRSIFCIYRIDGKILCLAGSQFKTALPCRSPSSGFMVPGCVQPPMKTTSKKRYHRILRSQDLKIQYSWQQAPSHLHARGRSGPLHPQMLLDLKALLCSACGS